MATSTAQLSPFEIFPDEILLNIFSNFDTEVPRPDEYPQIEEMIQKKAPLLKLALCSKRLNNVATPGKLC